MNHIIDAVSSSDSHTDSERLYGFLSVGPGIILFCTAVKWAVLAVCEGQITRATNDSTTAASGPKLGAI